MWMRNRILLLTNLKIWRKKKHLTANLKTCDQLYKLQIINFLNHRPLRQIERNKINNFLNYRHLRLIEDENLLLPYPPILRNKQITKLIDYYYLIALITLILLVQKMFGD